MSDREVDTEDRGEGILKGTMVGGPGSQNGLGLCLVEKSLVESHRSRSAGY
jgi:hypothetical protein